MVQLQHVDVTHRCRLVKRLTRFAVIQLHTAVVRQACFTHVFVDFSQCSTIENRGGELQAEFMTSPTQNGFINLGIGEETDDETVISTIGWLISTPNVRKEMRKLQLQKDFSKGHERVIRLILDDADENPDN